MVKTDLIRFPFLGPRCYSWRTVQHGKNSSRVCVFVFQAIELSAEALGNVKFIQEKKLLSQYFQEISRDTGKFCFGVKDTLNALEQV